MFDVIRYTAGIAIWTGVCAWSISRGGPAERIGGIATLVGTIVTPFVQIAPEGNQVEPGIFAVDCVMLLIFTVIALRSNKWWTIYAAAFMLCQALTHVVRIYNENLSQFYYATAAIFWSYMGLFALAFGVGQLEFDRWGKARLRRAPAATPLVAASAPPAGQPVRVKEREPVG